MRSALTGPLSPGCLVDGTGRILVPGISQAVAPVTQEELELYDRIDFDLEEYAQDVGTDALLHGCKTDILMHRWRYPSLSLHGIEGAFSGSGAKTVIPRKVIGKFSIRLVPDMTPEVVSEQARGVLGYGAGLLCTSGDLGYKRLQLRLRAAGRHKTQISFRTSGLWPTQ